MVKNPGTQTRTGAIKLLNAPTPIAVRTDPAGVPAAVATAPPLFADRPQGRPTRRGKSPHAGSVSVAKGAPKRARAPWQAVASIDDCWKINDEWWRGPDQRIERMYYSVLLESGQRIILFHDMARETWFRQGGIDA